MPAAIIERGWVRLQLIRELAVGEKTSPELGEKYGVDGGAIRKFAQRHREQIDQVKANLDDEYAGLWIVERKNRIAEYESDIALLNDSLATETDDKIVRTKLAVLRQTAEELGQLTQKIETSGTVHYVITGVDPAVLK